MLPPLSIPDLLHTLRVLSFIDFTIYDGLRTQFNDPYALAEFSLRHDPRADAIICEYNNGQGDDFAMFLCCSAAVIFGLTHESPVWRAVMDGDIDPRSFFASLPRGMLKRINSTGRHASGLQFSLDEISFCFHRTAKSEWIHEKPWIRLPSLSCIPDPDLTDYFLNRLNLEDPYLMQTLQNMSERFYDPTLQIPKELRNLKGVNAATVRTLHPEANPDTCLAELDRLLSLKLPT